jgi:hypothetical protein
MGDDHVLNELLDLKDKIIKAIDEEKKDARSNSTRDRVKDILVALDKITVTASLISKSKLGNTISSVRTEYAKSSEGDGSKDKEIEQLAKELLLKWKSIMDAKKGDKKSEKKTASSSSTATTTTTTTDKEVKSSVLSRSSSPLPIPSSSNTASNLSDSRIKIVNAIKDIFTSNDNSARALDVAVSIEGAVHNLFPNDFKQYRSKVVSLNFNLKKNEKLRMQVYDGIITAALLVTLSVQELASDKVKEERHHIKENESSSKRLDWNEEHREEMFGELGLDSTIKWEYEEDDYSDPGD